MFGCVLSELKFSECYIISCEKSSALDPFTTKNVELLGPYPIRRKAYGTEANNYTL